MLNEAKTLMPHVDIFEQEQMATMPRSEFVSHIRVLNHDFLMNVATIQPQNGYNQYYFALYSAFFEAKLIQPRPGRDQMLEAKARILALRP